MTTPHDDAVAARQLLFLEDLTMPEWVQRAACRGADTEEFFDPDTSVAVAVCHGCPVREQCFQYAMAHNLQEGIFGGTTPEQRSRIRDAVSLRGG